MLHETSAASMPVALNFFSLSHQPCLWQTFTVLHTFTGGSDGQSPSTDLILDTMGNLYGTTYGLLDGGTTPTNCGTIFKIDKNGK